MPDFSSMSRDELAAWYEGTVGYNPAQDDPSIETEDLRAWCSEMRMFDLLAEAELMGRPFSYLPGAAP